MNATSCKLNLHVDGNKVSETVFNTYVEMMDAARDLRDAVAAKHPGGFVVAQFQRMGPHGWYHGAILS